MGKKALRRALAALLWPALALGADVKILEEIIAKVNGEIVTRSELERSVAQLRESLRQQNLNADQMTAALAEGQKDALRDLIDQSLLVQKGKELNLSVEPQLVKWLDEMRRQRNIATMEEFERWAAESTSEPFEDVKDRLRNQMLTQRVIQQEIRVNVSKDEVSRYYEEHQKEFVRPEQVRLRQILVSTEGKEAQEIPALEKKANDILARLRKGERFAEVASKVSDDAESAKAGGDIGFFRRGLLDKPIEEIVFNAQRGLVTGVLKRPNGFLILRVEERHREGQATQAEVEQDISERLYTEKMQPAVRAYLTKLREDAFLELRAGVVDSGAAPGKDTAWKDPEQFKPAVTTKAEATKKKRRLLWVVPLGGGKAPKEKGTDKKAEEKGK